jgi:hypothetical protein
MMMLRTALKLASCGLRVFPCGPRQKTPAVAGGCNAATTDADVIRGWWHQEPNFNVAIATGQASGVFAIDIDSTDAEGALRRLEQAHGALPPTVEAITPRPGRHIYFQHPGAPLHNSAGKVAPGIDVRGDGGYVLAPPSIHPSGRAYAWSVDTAHTVAAAPGWLLDRIGGHARDKPPAPTPPSVWRELVANGVAQGQRDTAAARLAGYLLRHRLDPLLVLEMLQLWNATRCRPPLHADDIARVVNSLSGAEARRRQGNGGH